MKLSFNPTLGLILTKQESPVDVILEDSFNPTLGLILTQIYSAGERFNEEFQSYLRSDSDLCNCVQRSQLQRTFQSYLRSDSDSSC